MTGDRKRTGRLRAGFTGRLLAAQSLVLLASALTTWVVASVVGPSIFHDHLVEADVPHSPTETAHVEMAFRSALLVSLSVALLAALVAALAVSWYSAGEYDAPSPLWPPRPRPSQRASTPPGCRTRAWAGSSRP